MTDEEIITEMLARSDAMANTIAKSLNALPDHEHNFSVAVMTFLRMGSYAALRLGMPREHFEASAGEIFDRSKAAMLRDDYIPTVKH